MPLRHLLAGVALVAGLAAAEAQAQTQTTIVYGLPSGHYYLVPADAANKAMAYNPRSATADLNRGMWGAQPITPPSGLALVEQGDYIGRKVYDGSGTSFGTVRRVLVDPLTGLVHYFVISTPEVANAYIPVPASALDASNMEIGMSAYDLRLIQAYSMDELERRYPPTRLAVPVIVGPVAMVPATTTVVTQAPPAPAGSTTVVLTTPYRMTQGGDWVGRAVTDPSGDLVGVVDYLLTDPATGAVRQAAVSGGPIGRGNYVLIPSANLRLSQGRLVADQTVAALLSGPRLQQAELIQRYGPVVAAQ
jgi:sporulation protein YlmC with PRC-barrel domain